MGTVYANSTFVICCKVSSQLCTLEEDPVMLVGSIQQAECEKKFSLSASYVQGHDSNLGILSCISH